jgi:hypothetical protein
MAEAEFVNVQKLRAPLFIGWSVLEVGLALVLYGSRKPTFGGFLSS